MSKIFDGDSDSDVDIKIDNNYAKNYDVWRKKEVLNKLKAKYGDDVDIDEESTSSSDDEDGEELTEEVEKDFLKTLACLKNKDPRIYDANVKFFEDNEYEGISKRGKSKKQNGPMYLKDYERNIILEKGGVLSDEEDDAVNKKPSSPTYVEEQQRIKENLKSALNSITDDNDEEWGGLFRQRQKTTEENEKEEADFKKWLMGQKQELDDKNFEQELKPLKDYWNDPKLDQGEKFLRDYILNKKFLDNETEDYIPSYDEIIHDSDDLSNDEEILEKQEEFEHKYNFRFEDPDQEFIKRYPRTIENSLRREDNRRKLKRQETKERKKKEKETKMQDLKKLQELKRKEIEEKLEKLKEITGNASLGFQDDDVEGDFDPDAHDRRMQTLFNDEYYQGPEGEQKPEFPELDEELEIENWERYDVKEDQEQEMALHCEDEGFNMDCEYDSKAAIKNELIDNTKRRKKRKRKSKFAEALSKPKPKFDPDDKNYEQYFEEYYKLDCEDIVADIPCRFKYRKVMPNDFGLSIEEILLAKERELNRWCSLKKSIQIRPDHVEKYDQIAYGKKAQNIHLKKKILPSLFVEEAEENSDQHNSTNSQKNLENKEISTEENSDQPNSANSNKNNENKGISTEKNSAKKKRKKKGKQQIEEETIVLNTKSDNLEIRKEETEQIGDTCNDNVRPNKKKKKKKGKNSENIEETMVNLEKNNAVDVNSVDTSNTQDLTNNKETGENLTKRKLKKKNKKKKLQQGINGVNQNEKRPKKRKLTDPERNKIDEPRKKFKKFKPDNNDKSKVSSISDARLAAFGINPKKFKNKLKYGKK